MAQITINIDDNYLNQIKDAGYPNPELVQKALRDALKTAQSDDSRFNLALDILTTNSLTHAREQRSWTEFLRDVFIEKLNEYDPDFSDPYDATYRLLEQYTADGSYTYNTRASIDLISDFWSDFNDPDYEAANMYTSYLNPNIQYPRGLFDSAELFLVRMMVTDGGTLLTNILDDDQLKEDYAKDGAWTSETLSACLVDMDSIDLSNYLYD